MTTDTPAPAQVRPSRSPAFGYGAFTLALRYLVKKKLAYLAVLGIALSVGTLIVVMSVFTGFHQQLTGIIRGYLSDLIVQPRSAGMHSHELRDWQLFRRLALANGHVAGAAPFVQSVALMRLPRTDYMSYVFVRGVEPQLEPAVSDLPDYMTVGEPGDLDRTFHDAEGGSFRSCFVGSEFPGFSAAALRHRPGQLILVTATRSLDKRLRQYAVNGMFETGNYEYDSQMVLMGLDAAMDLVDSRGGVTGLSVKLDDYENADAARDEMDRALGRGAILRTLGGGGRALRRIGFSGDGSRVVALSEAGEALVWDAVAQEPLLAVGPGQSALTAAALDHAGERLAVGREDGAVALHAVAPRAAPVVTPGRGSPVTCVAFSPDARVVAAGYEDGEAALLEVDTGDEVARLSGHAAGISEIAFDRHGDALVTASLDGTARVWDALDGRALAELRRASAGEAAPLQAVTFGADDETVAAGDAAGRATLWRTAGGGPLLQWQACDGPVLAIGIGEGANQLVTGGRDGFDIWIYGAAGDLGASERYARVASPSAPLRAAAVGADGSRLAGVGSAGQAQVQYGGSGFRFQTWEEQRKTFVEAVAMERFMMALILSLILVVAEFFIFAIVTTIVNERRRDIGILKAVGFTRGQICAAFLLVGLAVGVLGAALGVAGGLAFADNINAVRGFIKATVGFDPFPPDIYYFKDIPAVVTPFSVLLTAGGAIVCSLLFSIVPALRAARLDPVHTLHYE